MSEEAVLAGIPADYQDALDFGYHSGWRRGEIFRLEWRDIDRGGGVIRPGPSYRRTGTDGVAMTMTGHKTRSVFDRYNIVNAGDLRQAALRHADYVSQQDPSPTVVSFPGMSRS